MAPRGSCAACGGESGLRCSGCALVFYCGAQHQVEHWPRHRLDCRPYCQLRVTSQRGTHTVAARHINKGTVILLEEPLLVGPAQFSCSNCTRLLPADSWPRCLACGVPLCAPDCARVPLLHSSEECALIRDHRAGVLCAGSVLLSYLVTLRGLMLSGPKAAALRSLQSNLSRAHLSRYFQQGLQAPVEFIQSQFRGLFLEEKVRVVKGVLMTNAFGFFEDSGMKGIALYEKLSFFSHSCVPNARYAFFGSNGTDFSGAIISTVDIEAGTEICIPYTDRVKPTSMRRAKLLQEKLFLCDCARCLDPTELGLNCGTLCCRHCRDAGRPMSILVPSSPDPVTAVCRCHTCGIQMTFQEMKCLFWRDVVDSVEPNLTSPVALEGILKRLSYPNGLLHPTFYGVINIKLKLVEEAYGYVSGFTYSEMTSAELSRKLALCRELLGVMDVLAPGHSVLRGSLLGESACTLLEMGHRSLAALSTAAAQVALHGAQRLCAEAKEILFRPADKPAIRKLEKELLVLHENIKAHEARSLTHECTKRAALRES